MYGVLYNIATIFLGIDTIWRISNKKRKKWIFRKKDVINISYAYA